MAAAAASPSHAGHHQAPPPCPALPCPALPCPALPCPTQGGPNALTRVLPTHPPQVRLRPSKGPEAAASSPPLAEGVVYRVADSSIVVAVDDLPEDGGLDVPLRLEKLANEVTYRRLKAALQVGAAPGGVGAG